ncbi:Cytochrome c biogenesis protein, transmembrane region [Oleispira antarctica RB-8]|uniref:Cytochrome c biogenesis protein, transmembrane region n=1 Tax=Oleispira antarctica RB-8 TaxID=698738 RepID=R4YRC0_OLEAN|nr:Cytochrome c biogenesis protein, transmembrane region [Oleispira antarctica RB-8]
MIEPLSLITAFLLGLMGASHCMVMCGGIAAAASSATHKKNSSNNNLSFLLLFNLGRITSYSIAGLIVSLLGLWLADSHQIAQQILRSIAGVLLLLMGFYVARWWMLLTRLESAGQFIWRYIQPMTRKLIPIKSKPQALALGLLWGWLPCGLIYSTLAWVAANGEPALGALTMFCFGLGTLPGILAAGIFAQQLNKLISHSYFRQLAGALLICYGIWTLFAIW